MISTDTSADVVEGLGAPEARDGANSREPRTVALAALTAYLVASGVLLAAGGHSWLAVIHAVGVGTALSSIGDRRRVARIVGDLLPLIVAPILYAEIPLLIGVLGSSYHDALVQRWEVAVFGAQPSRDLATTVPNILVSELLHAGYLAYYPAIFLPPLILYARGNRRGYGETVAALTFVYLLCWTMYVVAPVEGPRYLWTPDAPSGPFRRMAVALLAAGSSRGAAFPSSHMAVSVTQAVMALHWQPRVGVGMSITAALVGLGAVYGGFHYGVDVIAGTGLGVAVAATTLFVFRNDRTAMSGSRP
jgi:membrane-associated phospholipid phosphatase